MVALFAVPRSVGCMGDLHKGLHYCRCASRPECQTGVLSQHAKSYDRSHPDEMDDDAASSWSWSQHHTDLRSLNTSEPTWILGTLMFSDWQTDRWSDIHSENLWSLRIGVKIGRPGALLYSNLCNLCSLPVYSFVRRRSRDVFIRVLAGSSFFFLC